MTKLAMFLILSFGLTLVSKINAQSKEDVYILQTANECSKTGVIESLIKRDYNEKPFSVSKIFIQSAKDGRLYQGILVTYVNPETRSYSLVVQFIEDGYSCILGSGTDFGPAIKLGTEL